MKGTGKGGRLAALVVPAAIACVAGLCTPTWAQDALGDGRALDANLQEGSGGRNQASRDFKAELAFRNAIVTGNAPGGKSFRGEVGYTAADDFRGGSSFSGGLGSNDLFRFQRDSFSSGLATRNLRGISGLRVQFDNTIGGQSFGMANDLIVDRAGGGASARNLNATPEFRIRLDGSLRSTTEYNLLDSTSPDLLGAARNTSGDMRYLAASPLQGVRAYAADAPILTAGQPRNPSAMSNDPVGATPMPAQAAGAHSEVLSSLRMRTEQLSGIKPVEPAPIEQPAAGEDVPPAVPAIDPFDRMLQDIRQRLADDAAAADAATEGGEETTSQPPSSLEALREPVNVDRLVAPEESGSVYGDHMTRAQDFMATGQWFDAEERFTAALGGRPGDPMAAAGRLNAQIAAGMYRSAAVNLTMLMRANPEMAAARFAPALLPNAQRMEQVTGQLRERSTRRTAVGRDCALLLAYMGFQTGDRDMLEAGFREFDATEAELKLGADPVVELLREVWLNPGS